MYGQILEQTARRTRAPSAGARARIDGIIGSMRDRKFGRSVRIDILECQEIIIIIIIIILLSKGDFSLLTFVKQL